MTDQNAPARRHYAAAREHLADHAAVREQYQQQAAAHLAGQQQQPADQPYPGPQPEQEG